MKTLTLVVTAVVGVVLAFSVAGHAQQKLDNQDIVKMVKAGLAEEVLLNMISSQPTQFAITPDDIIALKKDGVSDKIIAAMVSKGQPTAPTVAVQPTNTAVASGVLNQDIPNNSQILAAIRSDPNRNNPRSWTALALSRTPLGSGARINNIDVTISGFRTIQWGEFNSAGKYWPAELCVNGTADNRVMAILSPLERAANRIPQAQQFQTKAQYRLYKDDFGELKAQQILVSEWKPQDSICPAASLASERAPQSAPNSAQSSQPQVGSAQSYFNDGVTFTNRGLKKEAAEAFRKAIASDPTMAPAYFQLGTLDMDSRDTVGDAVVMFEKFIAMALPTDPNVPAAQRLLNIAKQLAARLKKR